MTIRHFLAASGLATLTLTAAALPGTIVATAPAYAQGEAPKPVELTQKQIDGLLAAQPEIASAQPQSDKPDPKAQAKLEAIVKKHGFASLDEYGAVADTVSIVIGGIDPEKKTYVGQTAIIQKQIADVQADKSMKPKDKADALKELKAALKAGDGEKPSAGNIDLVGKNYDKLAQALQGGGSE